jgi:hypothetical protein
MSTAASRFFHNTEAQLRWTVHEPIYVLHSYNHHFTRSRTLTSSTAVNSTCLTDLCKNSDKSIPIYNAYNHHYFGWLIGCE